MAASPLTTFWDETRHALAEGMFVKLTLSKPAAKGADWRNVYARPVTLRGQLHLSFTLHMAQRDETRNYLPEEGLQMAAEWLGADFLEANLFTLQEHLCLLMNKKREARLQRQAAVHQSAPATAHDRAKQRPLAAAATPASYLTQLGIAGADGQILQKGQRKFRQINKYVEIIGHLLAERPLRPGARIVDMGSGKGYLTFALYDYLTRQLGNDVQVVGVELRPDLVEYCNEVARQSGFTGLSFVAGSIDAFPDEQMDMLIALHACDTATDMALAKGIKAGAACMVVAPCCHKQLRRDTRPPAALQPLQHYGILWERQMELLTDTLRALLLEARGYTTKTIEFVGVEHTPKNVMITALKAAVNPRATDQIAALKAQFGVTAHALETLLEEA
jgi:SAM-dependent methyltransferase